MGSLESEVVLRHAVRVLSDLEWHVWYELLPIGVDLAAPRDPVSARAVVHVLQARGWRIETDKVEPPRFRLVLKETGRS